MFAFRNCDFMNMDNANQKTSEETLLNKQEAADFLGVSLATLWRLGAEINCYRIGRRVFFSKEKHLLPYREKTQEIYQPKK